MTREELQNKHGDAICEYCNKNIISKYNPRQHDQLFRHDAAHYFFFPLLTEFNS